MAPDSVPSASVPSPYRTGDVCDGTEWSLAACGGSWNTSYASCPPVLPRVKCFNPFAGGVSKKSPVSVVPGQAALSCSCLCLQYVIDAWNLPVRRNSVVTLCGGCVS
jgi:hypothetical protein